MKLLPYVLLSFFGGAIVPLQLAMVHAFRQSTHATQMQSTFYLYLGGALLSCLLSFVLNGHVIPPQADTAKWWMWTTGFLGSFYILFMFIATPNIGAENTLLWVFLGQMFFALFIQYFGWFGLESKALNPLKILGLFLIIIGGVVMLYAEKDR